MPDVKGLSDGDKSLLKSSQTTKSNFGIGDDYARIYVYDFKDESLVTTFDAPSSAFRFEGSSIDINIGQHLRSNGITDGRYRVVYYFYRALAGSDGTIRQRGITYPNKYFLSSISKDRTEVEIRPSSAINLFGYQNGLGAVNGFKLFQNVPNVNVQWEFSNPVQNNRHILSLPIADNEPGFTENMTNGTITIPKVYHVEEVTLPPGLTADPNFDKDVISY